MRRFPCYRNRFDGEQYADIPHAYHCHLGEVLDFCNETSNVRAAKGYQDHSDRQEAFISVAMCGVELFAEWVEFDDPTLRENSEPARHFYLGSVDAPGWCVRFTYESPHIGRLSLFERVELMGDRAAFVRDMTMLRTIGITQTSLRSNMKAYHDA